MVLLPERLRVIWFLCGGILVACVLFLVMHQLISGEAGKRADASSGDIVGMIRVKEAEQMRVKARVRPEKPPPPKAPPPPPALKTRSNEKPARTPLDVRMPDIDIPNTGGGPFLGVWSPGEAAAEGEAVPIVRIDPQWPRQALEEGIEGFVRLEVLIGTDGGTKDVKVLESKPGSLFVRNAIRAVQRWKFKPKIVDGVAMERWARTTIEFELAE